MYFFYGDPIDIIDTTQFFYGDIVEAFEDTPVSPGTSMPVVMLQHDHFAGGCYANN